MEIKYYTTENDYLILLNKILEKSIFGKKFEIFVWVTISAGSTILTITDNYIQETTETTTSKSLWSEIEGMKTSNTHIFIFFTPLIAAVIPKTAFSNLIEYDDFTNKVTHYIESNHV